MKGNLKRGVLNINKESLKKFDEIEECLKVNFPVSFIDEDLGKIVFLSNGQGDKLYELSSFNGETYFLKGESAKFIDRETYFKGSLVVISNSLKSHKNESSGVVTGSENCDYYVVIDFDKDWVFLKSDKESSGCEIKGWYKWIVNEKILMDKIYSF